MTSHPKPSEPLIGLSWPPVGRIYLYSRSGRGRGQGNAVANVAMCESSGCGNDSTSGRIHRAAAPPEDTHRSHSPSALRAAPSRQDGLPGVADAAQVGPPVSAGAGSGFWRGVRVRTEAAGEGMRGMANFCGCGYQTFFVMTFAVGKIPKTIFLSQLVSTLVSKHFHSILNGYYPLKKVLGQSFEVLIKALTNNRRLGFHWVTSQQQSETRQTSSFISKELHIFS